ncbi:MAG: adenosylcobinamide-phosphate synthase CbiB [Candidatus Korobacteraceae bacterium]
MLDVLRPSAPLLAAAVLLDLAFGDPVYPAHPARLIGWTLTQFEKLLRSLKLDGYVGGVLLFLLLAVVWCGGTAVLIFALARWSQWVALAGQVFLIYSLLALRDLLQHGWAVELAARQGDLPEARCRVSRLVGRETDRMDLAACRRAAIESLSENLTDGFVSPIFWYAVAGLPGIVLFKVVSTMDSMVGYKTPLYLRFGWCGARLDDVMNWVPARINWLLISLCAAPLPGYSGRKALRIGWLQHALMPGPNSGWSEATTAGAIQRRLVGQIWRHGQLVTELWLGDANDPPAGDDSDVRRSAVLLTAAGLSATALALLAIAAIH